MSNGIAHFGNNTLVGDGITGAVKLPFRTADLVHDTTKDIYDVFAAPFRAPTTGKGIVETLKSIPRFAALPIDVLQNISKNFEPYMPKFVAKTIDYVHNFKDYLLMEKGKRWGAGLKKFWSNIKGGKKKPAATPAAAPAAATTTPATAAAA